jgi:hypothetical protein
MRERDAPEIARHHRHRDRWISQLRLLTYRMDDISIPEWIDTVWTGAQEILNEDCSGAISPG